MVWLSVRSKSVGCHHRGMSWTSKNEHNRRNRRCRSLPKIVHLTPTRCLVALPSPILIFCTPEVSGRGEEKASIIARRVSIAVGLTLDAQLVYTIIKTFYFPHDSAHSGPSVSSDQKKKEKSKVYTCVKSGVWYIYTSLRNVDMYIRIKFQV